MRWWIAGFRMLSMSLILAGFGGEAVFAQGEGVRIERATTFAEDDVLLDKAKAFMESKVSLDVRSARQQLRRPRAETITLRPPSTKPLTGRGIAQTARRAFLRFGWYGLDEDGLDGFSLGAAYAITDDGVFATCHHCVDPEGITEGCLVAMTETDQILPVKAILAHDRDLDAAIVRVDLSSLAGETKFVPLAFNTDVFPGDKAYCYSDPLDAYGYFSDGIVNRFYRVPPPERNRNPVAADALALLRLNVSTDWAPGSSGAAVLDECGNAIGHVSAIWSLSDDVPFEIAGEPETESEESKDPAPKDEDAAPPPEKKETDEGMEAGGAEKEMLRTDEEIIQTGPVLITLHEAIPAAAIRKLIEKMNQAAGEKSGRPAGTPIPARGGKREPSAGPR